MKKTIIAPKPSASSSAAIDSDAWVSGGGQPVPPTGERMKRFTFDVPESLHRRVKATCAARGKDMADEMRRILQEQFPE
jgi:hypothetical protein